MKPIGNIELVQWACGESMEKIQMCPVFSEMCKYTHTHTPQNDRHSVQEFPTQRPKDRAPDSYWTYEEGCEGVGNISLLIPERDDILLGKEEPDHHPLLSIAISWNKDTPGWCDWQSYKEKACIATAMLEVSTLVAASALPGIYTAPNLLYLTEIAWFEPETWWSTEGYLLDRLAIWEVDVSRPGLWGLFAQLPFEEKATKLVIFMAVEKRTGILG